MYILRVFPKEKIPCSFLITTYDIICMIHALKRNSYDQPILPLVWRVSIL